MPWRRWPSGPAWRCRTGLAGACWAGWLARGSSLGLLGIALYLPFYAGFQSQAGGLLPNLFFPTRLSQYFLMFGPFLVVAVFFLLLLSYGLPRRALLGRSLRLLLWLVLLPIAFLGLILGAGAPVTPGTRAGRSPAEQR